MRFDSLVKVNIGSGPHGKSDWINLDWGVLPLLSKMPWLCYILAKLHLIPKSYHKPWPSKPRLYDCRRKLPFLDNSVDYIYTSHFIEHLRRYQTIKLLAECKRILRPGGILRICVPDMKLLTQKYIQCDKNFFLMLEKSNDKENQLNNLTDLFVQHFYGYDSWSRPTLMQKTQQRFIRGHLWMYDYESLRELLDVVGFSIINRCEPGKGNVPDIEYLDIHKIGSLFIEAKK